MRRHQIVDVDVVADAGAVRRVVVVAEDLETVAQSERGVACHLDHVGGARRGLSAAALRVGAGDVEVTQGHVGKVPGRGGIAQDPLGHQLGSAVGVDRHRGRVFRDRHRCRHAVDRRGRGKDEAAHPAGHAGLDQRAARAGVVAVVFERVGHGFRHHDAAGEVDHGGDAVAGDEIADQCAVAGVALDEGHVPGHPLAAPGGEVVQHDDRRAGVPEREHGVAADVAGAAGDQDGVRMRHGSLRLPSSTDRRRRS